MAQGTDELICGVFDVGEWGLIVNMNKGRMLVVRDGCMWV